MLLERNINALEIQPNQSMFLTHSVTPPVAQNRLNYLSTVVSSLAVYAKVLFWSGSRNVLPPFGSITDPV